MQRLCLQIDEHTMIKKIISIKNVGRFKNAAAAGNQGLKKYVLLLARIIHQPKKPTKEGTLGSRMLLKTAVSQEHHHPKTSASGCPGTVQIGLIVAIRHNASWQPPQAYNKLFARGPSTLSTALHRTC